MGQVVFDADDNERELRQSNRKKQGARLSTIQSDARFSPMNYQSDDDVGSINFQKMYINKPLE